MEEKTKRSPWPWIVFGVVALFILLVGFIGFAGYYAMRNVPGASFGEGDIALIHIEGVISASKSAGGLFGIAGRGSEDILKILDRVSASPHYKAIVLRVNSPGGTAAASQEIYEKLMQIRKTTDKKIVVSMGDVAASGAYYISSTADKIYAERATLTGSIGVIAELMDMQGLYKKLGVSPQTLKAGRLKDIGSQSRAMTPEEKKIFQTILDEAHSEFIEDVAKARNLPVDTVQSLADGRVYTGKQALELKLIDGLGDLEDAEQAAAKLAGMTGKFKVFDADKKTLMEEILGDPSSETLFPGRSMSSLLFILKSVPSRLLF